MLLSRRSSARPAVFYGYRRIPGLGSEGMTQPFWRAIHELSDTDRLTPGRASTVDGHNIMGSPGRMLDKMKAATA